MAVIEDIKHELKMIERGHAMVTRGQSLIKKGRERLAAITDGLETGVVLAPAALPNSEKSEKIRERVLQIVQAPDYVSKFR